MPLNGAVSANIKKEKVATPFFHPAIPLSNFTTNIGFIL
jgi:hypothetical protein